MPPASGMNTRAAPRRPSRAGAALVWLVLAGALAVRIWHLGARSLWTDEASTWTASHGSLAHLVRFCIHEDASPPLYYMLTSAVTHALGDGEAQLRLVSVLASMAIVWLTYRFARLFAPRAESALAAALAALSTYQIMYAQEARTYMLVAAWMTLASYLFARAVWHGRSNRWPWYALALAGALYTQAIGLLAAGAHGAMILFSREGRRHARGFFLSLAGAIALYAPWLFASLQQAGHLPQSHWYVPVPDVHGTFLALRAILISPVSLVTAAPGEPPGLAAWMPASVAHGLLILGPVLPLLLCLPALAARDPRGATLRFAAASVVLPLAAVFLVSLRAPLWLPRYFVFTTPFIAVLIAHGTLRMRPAALRAIWIVLLLAASGFAVWRYDAAWTKEPWRTAAGYIEAQGALAGTGAGGTSVAVLVPFDDDAMRYYFRNRAQAPDVFEVSHPADPFASSFTRAQLDEVEARARAETAGFDEVWVVIRSANSDVRREVARRAEVVAGQGRARLDERVFRSSSGPVRVVRYARVPPAPERP